MKKAIKRILTDTCDRFYCYRGRVLEFKDPEDLHQMRVSGRTLLSYFSLLADKEEASRPGFLKLRRPLKETMGLLGEIRDLDVLMAALDQRSNAMAPEEKALVDGLRNRMLVDRVRLREQLAVEMPERIGPRWRERMVAWIKKSAPALADRESIENTVAGMRKKKENALIAIRNYPAPDLADEEYLALIHAGRISVKKLRYTLNILKSIDSADKQEIEALRALQDQLGNLQDIRVWTERLYELYGYNGIVNDIASRWRSEMRDTLAGTGLLGPEASNK